MNRAFLYFVVFVHPVEVSIASTFCSDWKLHSGSIHESSIGVFVVLEFSLFHDNFLFLYFLLLLVVIFLLRFFWNMNCIIFCIKQRYVK